MTNSNEGKSVLLTDAVTDYFDEQTEASRRDLEAQQFVVDNMDMIISENDDEERLVNTLDHDLSLEDLAKKQDLLKPR